MIDVGQVRGAKVEEAKIAVVTRLMGERFMVSEKPGEMIGPWSDVWIDVHYPHLLGQTDDPGHYKLLAALNAFFGWMGIPPQARTLVTVRARVAGLFLLAAPDERFVEATPVVLPVMPTAVEIEAVRCLYDVRWMLEDPAHTDCVRNIERTRAELCDVLGFVDPPAPPYASYPFHALLDMLVMPPLGSHALPLPERPK